PTLSSSHPTSLSFSTPRRRPPLSTLSPYTTLFRSSREALFMVVQHFLRFIDCRLCHAELFGEFKDGDRRKQCRHQICALVFHLADRKSTRLNSSHVSISYAVFCLKHERDRRNMAGS